MNQRKSKICFWLGTLCSLLFAAFLCVFALDVFNDTSGFAKTVIALSIHLIPAAAVVVVLGITWWKESLGAAIFLAMGAAYLFMTWDRMHWSAYVVISGPLFLIAALFFGDWITRANSNEAKPRVG